MSGSARRRNASSTVNSRRSIQSSTISVKWSGLPPAGAVLIELAAARQQLATARRACLQIATGMVPPTSKDPAVTASVAAGRPAWVRTVRRKVEMTSVLVKGVDVARDGRSHLTAAPPTCGHQATSRQGREKNDSSEDMQRPLIDRWI